MVKSIEDIDKDQHYIQGHLDHIKMPDGRSLTQLLREQRRAGKIAWKQPPQIPRGFAYLGKDIIDVYKKEKIQYDFHEEMAKRQLEDMSDQDILKLTIQNGMLKKQAKRNVNLLKERDRLKEENTFLKSKLEIREIVTEKLTTKLKNEILEQLFSARPPEMLPGEWVTGLTGVYILFDGETPVYIGQSVNIPSRIGQHLNEKKGLFDSVRFFQCSKEDLDEKEMFLIQLFKPRLNGQYKHRRNPTIGGVILS